MWDYIAQSRQNDFRREAASHRLVRSARTERRHILVQAFQPLLANINAWLQLHRHTTVRPLIRVQEMQSCADA